MSMTLGSTKRDWVLQNQISFIAFNNISHPRKNITENSISQSLNFALSILRCSLSIIYTIYSNTLT